MMGHSNHTTPHISPPQPQAGFHGYYGLIAAALLVAAGCAALAVVCFRRRSRSDELRHRLIPVYSYDPAEVEDDWGEEDHLTTPSYNKGTLSLSAYGI
ncbi:small integral membrane protein 29-like [Betta splendens]|uniref:Small integral membrane protein 29-like n=1 Tax=Betta splendens TaxID=158456 RepID=A0A6P7MPB5_BETSP|nr:small integral membrane protein 29-like [Betta splendens]XP_029008691.1 small integral membrane protein 29-like [Betta splendens]